MLPKHINCTIKCCFRILSLFIILIHFYNDMMIMMIMMTCGLLRLPDSSDFNSPGTQGYKLTTTINLCNRTIVILINKSWFEYVGVQFQSADFFFGGGAVPALTFQQGASISSIFQTESLMFIEIYHQLSAVALMHSRWKKLGRSACWGLLNHGQLGNLLHLLSVEEWYLGHPIPSPF